MKRLLIVSFVMLMTSIGCPSKNDHAPAPQPPPEDFKAGALNIELESALNDVLDASKTSPQMTPCPESLLADLEDNIKSQIECGALRVPEFHGKESNRFLSVAFLKIQKDQSVKKPLLVIEQGGPGSSSMALTAHYLDIIPTLTESFDILAVEQRGTPWTRPSALCTELTEYSLARIDQEKTDEQEETAILKRCLNRVSEELNIDSISTFEIAQDLVFAASQFGYEKFNYYGVSYGTLVGQYLLQYSPDKIDKMILDSPVIPGEDWRKDAMSNFDSVMRKNLINYRNTNSSWNRTPEESVQHLNQLAKMYDSQPLRLQYNYKGQNYSYDFRSNHFRGLAFLLTTSRYAPEYLEYLIMAAEKRRVAPVQCRNLIEALVQGLISVDSDETDIMYQALICREFELEETNQDEILSSWTLVRKLYNSNDEDLKTETNTNSCSLDLPKGSQNRVLNGPVASNNKVLVVGGEADHVTSPKYVAIVASKFKNGHQAIFEGVGHGVLTHKSCITESLLGFLKSANGDFKNWCTP